MKGSENRIWLYGMYVLGIVAVSFSGIFVKWTTAEVSVVAMHRLFITVLILSPFVWKYRQEIAGLSARSWGLLVLSAGGLALHLLLWMMSLRYTSVASSTMILTLQPMMVMVASVFVFGIRANRAMYSGMGIALIGSIAIGYGDFGLSRDALFGDLLSFLSILAVSFHVMMSKSLRKHISAFVYNFFLFLTAALMFMFYNLAMGFAFGGHSSQEWGMYVLLAVIPTLFGHYLFNWLLKYMSASTVSMAIVGEPVVASLLAWQLLGEVLTTIQLVAGMFMIVGVWYFIRYGKETIMPRRITSDASNHARKTGSNS